MVHRVHQLTQRQNHRVATRLRAPIPLGAARHIAVQPGCNPATLGLLAESGYRFCSSQPARARVTLALQRFRITREPFTAAELDTRSAADLLEFVGVRYAKRVQL